MGKTKPRVSESPCPNQLVCLAGPMTHGAGMYAEHNILSPSGRVALTDEAIASSQITLSSVQCLLKYKI